jgi:signal transduction histidine kinase
MRRCNQHIINIAAHELRTPIQPILGLTQILRSQITDSKQQELLDVTIRNAKRLNKLSFEILDFTRLESHTFELNKEVCNLKDIIVNAMDDTILSTEYNSKNLQLLYEPHDILLNKDKSRIAVVMFIVVVMAIVVMMIMMVAAVMMMVVVSKCVICNKRTSCEKDC